MDTQAEIIGAVYIGNVDYAEELLGKGAPVGQDGVLHRAAECGRRERFRKTAW
jgi:hypothetical protein